MTRVSAGSRLEPSQIHALAEERDVLALGMLADTVRRRLHGLRTTFLRVAELPIAGGVASGVVPSAREVRLIGTPVDVRTAVDAVARARTEAGERTVSGFSWSDVTRLGPDRTARRSMLEALRSAGLDAFAELALDEMTDPVDSVGSLVSAGFTDVRLTVARTSQDRVGLLLRAGELQDAFSCVRSLNPLPLTLGAFRPTTGYDDVKAVALARLAAPNVRSIQVDWRRYGPKLAQVALAFGADDIDGVSASDEAPEGRRRHALEEIRRNIEAAGFVPVERDGRFGTPD
jgi:aminodeoxyfutalosine synthase